MAEDKENISPKKKSVNNDDQNKSEFEFKSESNNESNNESINGSNDEFESSNKSNNKSESNKKSNNESQNRSHGGSRDFGKKRENGSNKKDVNDEYDEDILNMLEDKFFKIFDEIPNLPDNFVYKDPNFKKTFKNLFKQFGISPNDMKIFDSKFLDDVMRKLKDIMEADIEKGIFEERLNSSKTQDSNSKFKISGPMMFGFNVSIGPDGKPHFSSFGNVKPADDDSDAEIRTERDPIVDIYEEDDQIVVVCEIPGVDKKDIELRASPIELEIIAGNSLEGLHSRKYHKTISLPAEVNPDIAKARYRNGILEVKLTKVGDSIKKKKIDIEG